VIEYVYLVHSVRDYGHGIKDKLLKAFCKNIRCVACLASAKSVAGHYYYISNKLTFCQVKSQFA